MRTNIYIRREDEDAWAAIPDKPLFIHNAIQGQTKSREEPPRTKPLPPKKGFCKIHGTPKEACKLMKH